MNFLLDFAWRRHAWQGLWSGGCRYSVLCCLDARLLFAFSSLLPPLVQLIGILVIE